MTKPNTETAGDPKRYNNYLGRMLNTATLTGPNCWVLADDHNRIVAALQSHINALMLEHCPEEMTPGQLEKWEESQKAISDARQNEIDTLRAKLSQAQNQVLELNRVVGLQRISLGALTTPTKTVTALLSAKRVLEDWTRHYSDWCTALPLIMQNRLPPAEHVYALEQIDEILKSPQQRGAWQQSIQRTNNE